MKKKSLWLSFAVVSSLTVFFWNNSFQHVHAMHIMEGFLPIGWALLWWCLTLPFIVIGMRSLQRKIKVNPELKAMLGLAGVFAFVLSALKIPSVTGSTSHPTGTG